MDTEQSVSKKREWIKNVAIIFLAVMLLLTFFSNTIMNYSLAEVATEYVTSGSISTKIRGTGTVEAVDPYKVVVDETREIKSVAVKSGDTVEKGDVLYYLEDVESDELVTARDELAALKLAYEKSILESGLTRAQVAAIEAGNTESLSENQAKLEAAQSKIDEAQKEYDTYTAKVNDLNTQIDALKASGIDVKVEMQAVADANTNLRNAQLNLEVATQQSNTATAALKALVDAGVVETDPRRMTAQETVTATANAVELAKIEVTKWENAVANAQQALDLKKAGTDTENKVNSLTVQLVDATSRQKTAEEKLKSLQEEKDALLTDILAKMDIVNARQAIIDKQEVVDKLTENSIGSSIDAPVSGVVNNIVYVAGETTVAGEAAAVIIADGKGYQVSISVTNEQAKKVNVGDVADLQNSWYYSDVTAVLTNITNDKTNPGKSKLLVFSVNGESVVEGQSLSLSVGQKSANYDLIVPNSSIREDSNGKFILIVESRNTPFGNRYVASRIDVEVLASDDTQTAISAALYGYEYVITTSTKPIEAGDQIRLAE